ncbi:GNAT family N-acetyltransferase [Niveibacterium sp. 24ML]|uniref:GNAT family N-acetyltransferase n=1 Tax=Niveibacterium sp. 24ML TaxID=2985512 RepID=UPI00226DA1FD|nr:GNAT family N-acetyltransferase [Niveibacterium sp. 24ML]MCX9154974.1 GNAT family N-acetyltransferase [Niveibacterium sp. 24ML]
MEALSAQFELLPASHEDAEALVEIRIAAMRESLERIGRFDPQRARDRFLAGFDPAQTRKIMVAAQWLGFISLRVSDDMLTLEHLYLVPQAQGRGTGSAVMAWVIAQSEALQRPLRVGALRESASNRFYLKHGFKRVGESEWDIYYQRDPAAPE